MTMWHWSRRFSFLLDDAIGRWDEPQRAKFHLNEAEEYLLHLGESAVFDSRDTQQVEEALRLVKFLRGLLD